MQVYGLPLKDVIQETFGDGIMSAIDFTMQVEKEADSQGRPGQDHHVGEVPAIQEMVIDRSLENRDPGLMKSWG